MQVDRSTSTAPNGPHKDCALRFRKVIDSDQGRLSSEREVLLRKICNTRTHFTLESLLASLRLEGLRVSQATAYRTLPLLERAGIIRRVSLFHRAPNGAPLYEHVSDEAHHDHLMCSRCGLVLEFTDPGIEALQQVVASTNGFSLQHHHLELVGLCPSCQRAQPQGERHP